MNEYEEKCWEKQEGKKHKKEMALKMKKNNLWKKLQNSTGLSNLRK